MIRSRPGARDRFAQGAAQAAQVERSIQNRIDAAEQSKKKDKDK